MLYIGVEAGGAGAAEIEGRGYVFEATRRGERWDISIPRLLETDEFCSTVVRSRIHKLVRAAHKEREEVLEKIYRPRGEEYARELREATLRAQEEARARNRYWVEACDALEREALSKGWVPESGDAILALIRRPRRPPSTLLRYGGRARIGGERYLFDYDPARREVCIGSRRRTEKPGKDPKGLRILELLTRPP